MISLIIALIVLVVGYLFYSKLAERIFAPDNRNTPAIAINDGVDYIPMKSNKLFLIQLLNIAGTGPIFGIFFVIMALSILGGMLFNCENSIPEITLKNLHPNNLPVWPFMFVTVSCGAISGFHATQSPMVAKCISSEYEGRKVFYGAMISESVIALIWAAAGVAFYGTTGILNDALAVSGQSGVVYEISTGLLGSVGGFLAIVGIIVCPITSGDTSFRSARLILAEAIKLPQKSLKNRLALAFPVIIIAAVLSKLDFVVLWRYIGWTNQLVAMITLWVITLYLLSKGKYKLGSLITAIPASFMSAVAITYILSAPEGFSLSTAISYPVGIVFAIALFILYMTKLAKRLATNI